MLSICNFAPRPPQVADPVVTFCETVVETSSLKCFAETPNKKYVSRVIFLDLIQTNNSMRAVWDRLLIYFRAPGSKIIFFFSFKVSNLMHAVLQFVVFDVEKLNMCTVQSVSVSLSLELSVSPTHN